MQSLLSPDYKKNYQKTFYLAYPVVLSQLGHIMVGVVDTAMVGQIGTLPQAAVALANSFYVLVLVLGIGISYGVTPLVAAADSSNDIEENASLLKHSIIINTITGILLFLLLVAISPVLRMFNQQQEVVDLAIPFLNIMMLGMIPLCIFSGFKQFAEGLSHTRVAMFITLGSNLLNILLNYVLIFGTYGFPKMGLMGACWASFISRVAMAIAMFLYVFYDKQFAKYWNGFNFKNISRDRITKILAIGIPSGMQWVFELGAFSFAVIMIGWISPEAQAAHQVAVSIAAVTYMMASGLAAATSVRVGNQMGLKNREGVRVAGFSAMVMVMVFMIITAFCFILFRDSLPTLFNKEKQVIEIASTFIVIAAFFQISDGLQSVCLGALRGMKDVKIPTLITLIAYWGIGLPMSYVFTFKLNFGVQGVWYGLSLGLGLAAVFLFMRFNYVSKRVGIVNC
jgi:multidrug resistance protein, MATE family